MAQKEDTNDIVKRGYINIKRPPCSNPRLRLKAWQKKYVILRDISLDNGVSTFEIYDDEETWKNSGRPTYVLDLRNVTHVESYDASKRFAHAFMVARKGRAPLALACISVIEKHSWMEAVRKLAEKRHLIYKYRDFDLVSAKVMANSDRRPSCPGRINFVVNTLYNAEEQRLPPGFVKDRGWTDSMPGFMEPLRSNGPPTTPRTGSQSSYDSFDGGMAKDFIYTKCDGVLVHIQPSSDAVRNLLSGDYYMNVTGSDVTLTGVTSLKEAIKWPLSQILKFKSEENGMKYQQVTLEASVHCGKAHGCYLFQTSRGVDLIDKVKEATLNIASKYRKQISPTQQIIAKQFSSTTLGLDSYWNDRSQSTPDLVSGIKSSGVVRKEESRFRGQKKMQTSQGSTPYLELLHPDAAGRALDEMPLNYMVPEHADSGFDDSDEDRSFQSQNNSLDVFIPISTHEEINQSESSIEQDPPPLLPRGISSSRLPRL